jgi:hypothetical protein
LARETADMRFFLTVLLLPIAVPGIAIAAEPMVADTTVHAWKCLDGETIVGRLVGYDEVHFRVERIRDEVFLDGRPYASLGEGEKQMVVAAVERATKTTVKGKIALLKATPKQGDKKAELAAPGVKIQPEVGGEIRTVAVDSLQPDDRRVAAAGYEEWRKQKEAREEGERKKAKEAKAKEDAKSAIEARFTARVHAVKMLYAQGDYSYREAVVLAQLDANWRVELDIVSIEKPQPLFDKPRKLTLVVHSPVMLLHTPGEEARDRLYAFTVSGDLKEGKLRYNWAEAREVKP